MQAGRKHKALLRGSFGFHVQISPEQGWALRCWGMVTMGTDLGKEEKEQVEQKVQVRVGTQGKAV